MTLRGKKVLITGGLGFIGSNLAIACHHLGAAVTIYDAQIARSGANLFNIHPIRKDIELLFADIRAISSLEKAIIGKDILFHCAAFTSHPNSMEQPLEDIDVNCRGVVSLLEVIHKKNKDIRLVYVGTSTQIGAMQVSPITEMHSEFPLDMYSANKGAGEKYVLVYAHAYGLHAASIRLPNVFGPRANIANSDLGFLNYFIGLALQKKEIPIYGSGAQIRNVLYVDDAVSALIAAATKPLSDHPVFFAASDEHKRVVDIAEEITTVIGGTVVRRSWPVTRKRIEVGDVVIDSSAIKKKLKWKPEDSFRSGLEKTKTYFRRYGSHYGL